MPRAAQVEGTARAKAWGPENRNVWRTVRQRVVQEEVGQMDPQGLVGHG